MTESLTANETGTPLIFDRRHNRSGSLGGTVLLDSAQLGWVGINLQRRRFARLEVSDALTVRHTLLIQLNRPVSLRGAERTPGSRGPVTILPAGIVLNLASDGDYDCVVISLDSTFLQLASGGQIDPEEFELRHQVAVEDPLLEAIGLALLREVESGGASGAVYGESLAASLALHLAVRHGSKKPKGVMPMDNRASPHSVRKAVIYMSERLADDIPLRELADAAGQSTFHFARIFKDVTGFSPHQFRIRQRIGRAKQMLLRGDHSPAEVAAIVGFCDQSHFCRHFKRVTGLTPGEFLQQVRG